MKIWPDCIPCILKMSLGIARVAMKDEGQVRKFMEEILKLKQGDQGEALGQQSPGPVLQVPVEPVRQATP